MSVGKHGFLTDIFELRKENQMTFIEKIKKKSSDIYTVKPITLAFLGDSVTQGCFELRPRRSGGVDVIYDGESVYHNSLRKIFAMLCPQLPIAVINAGISGATAKQGHKRLEIDVLPYHPDMTVVCYGLNDCKRGMSNLPAYISDLGAIFDALRENGSDVIFMTPNMLGKYVSEELADSDLVQIASDVCTEENQNTLENYLDAAKALCREKKIPVCDCHANWRALDSAGFDITSLLSNRINHPTREMHFMFAYELIKTMLTQEDCND